MFYLFLQSGCRHPSFDVGYLFLSQKEWHSSTLWRVLYLSLRENLQSSIVWAILSIVSSIMFISIKNWFMRSFRGTIVFTAIHLSKGTAYFSDVRFRSYPILPTHFLSSYFRTPGIVKQTYYQRSYIFSAALIILKRVQLLEAATFSREDFFWRYICLKQLLLSNNCFLVTYTFFNQLFLADRYFFSTTTTSEELLLQNK